MKEIAIVINKNWETEPILDSLTNAEIRPVGLKFPELLNSPKDKDNKMDKPRAVYSFYDGKEVSMQVVIWCIQDLMYFNVQQDPQKQSSSSSEEKFRVLPPVLQAENPDLVIAVGTAGYPSDTSYNGSVVIGSNFFIHNGHPGNPKSDLKHQDIGKILISNVNSKVFGLINKDFRSLSESKFIRPPKNPAMNIVCSSSPVYTAISSVNVTDYNEYNWVDHEATEHYREVEKRLPYNSLETTHGVIKISTDKPIIFISAITDRIGHFDDEVNSSQNYVCAFNAGIVIGQLLVSLNDYVKKGGEFWK